MSADLPVEVQYAERDAKKPFRQWLEQDMDEFREDLKAAVTGDEVRTIAMVVITPFLKGGDACIAIENSLPCNCRYTDELYLREMMKMWMEVDSSACCYKIFYALHHGVSPDRANECRQVLSMVGVELDELDPTANS